MGETCGRRGDASRSQCNGVTRRCVNDVSHEERNGGHVDNVVAGVCSVIFKYDAIHTVPATQQRLDEALILVEETSGNKRDARPVT
jgi:hypothetical protein